MLTGLRGRLVFAMLVGNAVTLGVAATLLLSPLEHRLRTDELETLVQAVQGDRQALQRLSSESVRPGSRGLRLAARGLRRRTGAEVTFVDANGSLLASTDPAEAHDLPRATPPARHTRTAVLGSGRDAEARVTMSVRTEDDVIVTVIARRRLEDAVDAVNVVRSAFLKAALVSLAIALLLGLLLASRLVRRLRALRNTALRVADLGPVAEMAGDATRDEVGDLTRAFATMQERLREQEQSRRAFVATASHELRTPLSSLRLLLDMLRDDLLRDPPDHADALHRADRADAQAERLANLAGELLDLSRIDARVTLRSELVDLGEVARSVIAEFEVRATETGRELGLAAPDRVWAMGDPGSLAQIARILVDNAMRHSPPDGPIEINVANSGATATLVVRDHGPGVPDDARERIFERFERGPNPGNAPGFGLGLAIARELAVRMDGELSLDAREHGDGAAFRLVMPAATEADTS